MRSIRSWFTEARAATTDYTAALLAAQRATARGDGGSIKSNAAYRGSLTLIGHAAGVATLEGQHSAALQPHLSTIARSMVDTGESTWLINVGSTGGGGPVARHRGDCSGRAGPAHMDLYVDDAGSERGRHPPTFR